MKKNRNFYLIGGSLAVVIIIVIIAAVALNGRNASPEENIQQNEGEDNANAGEQQTEPEEVVTEAMYVPFGEDSYILVNQENSMVFTTIFPEEMFDINGNKITQQELAKGNVLKIYGNGVMAESYPGQYNGVTKIEVIKEGEPADADAYQNIVDEIYQEPDPAEPPTMNVEYITDQAVITAMINRGGYEWTYLDKDGTSNAVVADSEHVLNWGELLNDMKLEKPVLFTLSFSKEPQEVQAVRWSSELMNTQEDIPEGEEVLVETVDGSYVIREAEGGYVYEITAIWENGRANYGFSTSLPE